MGRYPFRAGARLFGLLAALLFGGMWAGRTLTGWVAPGSILAEFLGTFLLPLCLGLGMTAWYYVAFATVGLRLGRAFLAAVRTRGDRQRVFRDRTTAELSDLRELRPVPPGTWVFAPVALAISLPLGALIGLAPTSRGLPDAIVLFGATGFAYRCLLTWLARSGRLPIPEEV